MDTLGTLGTQLSLDVKQGSTLGPFDAYIKNPDGSPLDLTGSSIIGQIRKTPTDAAVAASFAITVVSAVDGHFQFTMTDETTATIPCGVNASAKESQYVWDMVRNDPLGNRKPLFYGPVRVQPSVTR